MKPSVAWLRGLLREERRAADDDGKVPEPPPLADLEPFHGLSRLTLNRLAGELGWAAIAGGSTLYGAGEPAEALYIVVSGLLGVVITGPDGKSELIAELHPGETAGEMSLLTGGNHSSTMVALKHTELYVMPRDAFARLAQAEPSFGMWLASLLAGRLHRTTFHSPAPARYRAVALVATDAEIAIEPFAAALDAALQRMGVRTARLGPNSLTQNGGWGHAGWSHGLPAAGNAEILLYHAAADHEAWRQFCRREADTVLLVAQPDSRPASLSFGSEAAERKPTELVLLEPPGGGVGTAAPDPKLFAQIHHLRPSDATDFDRLARRVAGRSVGLVLSGGAARGFAHIGAVRALREAGVPIDRVGGVSMGAIVGAGVARCWDNAEIRERMHATFVATNPLGDYTIPWIALFKGRGVERLLERNFGDIAIEALWLPFFCVSANLTRGALEIHRNGLLRRALRASVALPGVLPPLVERGEVLVDGGVLDNFPVETMAAGGRGPIIGVDVAGDEALMPGSEVPPQATGLLRLFRPRTPEMPGIVSILSRVGTLSSQRQRNLMLNEVTLLVEPKLRDVPLLGWQSFDQAIEAGRVATLEALERLDDGTPFLTGNSSSAL